MTKNQSLKSKHKLLFAHREVFLWTILFVAVAIILSSVFFSFNNFYIERVNNGESNQSISSITEMLFYHYISTISFFVLYAVSAITFVIRLLYNKPEKPLLLIIFYLIIVLLDSINRINFMQTTFQIIFNTICELIYEISVVPLVLYITLMMKKHQKKMLILLLFEVIAAFMYVIGAVLPDNQLFSDLQYISCGLIFIIICLTLLIFVIIEYKEGNAVIIEFCKSTVLIVYAAMILIAVSAIIRNDYFYSVISSVKSIAENMDIMPIRKNIIQTIIIFSVVTDFISRCIKDAIYESDRKKLSALEFELSENYAETVSKRIRDIRKIKHDFSNHIDLMSLLADNKDYIQLCNYIKDLKGSASELKPLSYSDNTIIDYLLMSYSEKAEKINARFTASAIVGGAIPISDSEICSLLSNILGNAVEGCERLGKEKEKVIRFQMELTNRKLKIICMNSCDSSKLRLSQSGKFITSKKDLASHGFGTGIITSICENHSGAVNFDCQNDIFTVTAVLPLD